MVEPINRAIKRIVPVNHYDEYFDDGATHAEIRIDAELMEFVDKAVKAAKALDASSIRRWDQPERFMQEDMDADEDGVYIESEDIRTEACELEVTTYGIQWMGYYKHTNVKWSVPEISMNELQENWNVLTCDRKDIPKKFKHESSKEVLMIRDAYDGDIAKTPLLINDTSNEYIRQIAKQRLENGE